MSPLAVCRFVCIAILLPLGVCAQFYYPDSKHYGSPSDYGLAFDDIRFASGDGTLLNGWHIHTKAPSRVGTIIHFHGNAQNISSHFHGIAWLAEHGFDLFLFDYRGFGQSEGKPYQSGVFIDCVAAIQEVQKKSPDETNFIVYGQSLGAANAIAVIGEIEFPNIVGVIAEAPFYSYRSIAKDKVNGFLDIFVGAVVSNKKSPHLVVDTIAPTPLLFIHGTADKVVPAKHSQRLYAKAKQPKSLWEVPNAGHLGIFSRHQQSNRTKLITIIHQLIKHAAEKK